MSQRVIQKRGLRMSDKKDYFDYVANVLGVKSILLNQDPSTVLPVVPLLICVQDLASYTEAEEELLTKMIAALKIDLSLIKVVDLNQSNLFQFEFAIQFFDDMKLNQSSSSHITATYSPRYLLKNPQDKKIAWDEMQKVILYFASRS